MKKLFLLLLLIALAGCNTDIQNQKTTIEIVDNHRRYWPILRGAELDVVFEIKNTGEHPLLISDIITSCGCMVVSKNSAVDFMPKGKEGLIHLVYDSTKNLGLARHYITLYGNFEQHQKKELVFEVNVVPESQDIKDYEEWYFAGEGSYKQFSDGQPHQKGYYLPQEFE